MEWLFHRGHKRPLKNTDIQITIHNMSKIIVLQQQQKQLYNHNMKTCIKGGHNITKVENHWIRGRFKYEINLKLNKKMTEH